MDPMYVKVMSGILALLFLAYSIVSFIYIDKETDKPIPKIDNIMKGFIYLMVFIGLVTITYYAQ